MGDPAGQLLHQIRQGQLPLLLGPRRGQPIRERDQGRQGLPRRAHRPGGGRGPVTVAEGGEQVPHQARGRGLGVGAGGRADLGDGVLDLGAVEELLRPAQPVPDPGIGQRLLDDLGLSVGAEQHGDLRGVHPVLVDQVPDVLGDAGGLLLVIGVLEPLRLGSLGSLGAQLQGCGPGPGGGVLGGAAGGQQAVGQGHHLRGGAVVAHQPHDLALRVTGGELQQVPGGRPGEGVDGLGGVAHHAQLLASTQPVVQEALLQRGDVLVLVHHEVPVLLAHGRGDGVVLLQDGDGGQQHVLEVDGVALGLQVLVGPGHPR
ncbi:Uncharacterised protein [Mycobacteroides abscessus subsp. abscessus]|nr:Uncharacterised protein [Mycobacteroides abscessus subsp. abscessus]